MEITQDGTISCGGVFRPHQPREHYRLGDRFDVGDEGYDGDVPRRDIDLIGADDTQAHGAKITVNGVDCDGVARIIVAALND